MSFEKQKVYTRGSARWTWLALFGMVAVAGCATVPATPEQIVMRRASERWESLLARDTDRAYAMLTPAFRQLTTPDQYRIARKDGRWVAAKVLDVNCVENTCKANVRIDFTLPGGQIGTTHMDENWINEQGSWWFAEKL